MDRVALDELSRRQRLSAAAIAAALDLTENRPDASAWRSFAGSLLRAAGLGGVGAGVLFFVAANWQDYGVLGRFALLEVALLGCVGVALWRPPPAVVGRGALVLATLLTGGLLALFGQSYQTGADVHELFFTWAGLALPFALAGASGALWAVWWFVVDVGLLLLCGWVGPEHIFWRFVTGWGVDRSSLLMLPCLVNLGAAGLFYKLRGTRFAGAAPGWLVRFLAGAGIASGTAATLMVVTGSAWRRDGSALRSDAPVVLAFAAICGVLAFATWARKRDVFPLALVAASWIAISTTWIARAMNFNGMGSFLLLALWLIAVSTAAAMLLMRWLRLWRAGPGPAGQGVAP